MTYDKKLFEDISQENKEKKKMANAIKSVREGNYRHKSAKIYTIPQATLRKYMKLHAEPMAVSQSSERLKHVFTHIQMISLKEYLREIDLKFFGMTMIQFRRLVYEFAERNGVEHPFSRETRMVGDDWLFYFLKEFIFTLRPSENVEFFRETVCSQTDIDRFFKILFCLKKRHNFLPCKVYHADEICISAVPNDLTRFTSASQLKRKGSSRMLVETRDNVTLVCCASASGSFIPPMIVFPRDKMIPGFLRGLPPGSIGYTSERGLINSELFLTFLKHFVQHALPSRTEPVLLLIDNYISYISLEALDFCKVNSVVVMGFPLHSRQKLQPLDISFFGPLKACYSHACDGFSDAYPRVKLTVDNVGEVFRTAYCRTATPENAINGFKESGIEPFQPQLFCHPSIFENVEMEIASILKSDNAAVSQSEDSDVEIVSWQVAVPNGTTTEKRLEPPEKRDTLEGTEKGDGESIVCLRCYELYPATKWLQCPSCRQWWHENCAGYHTGVHCDRCKDATQITKH